MAADIVKSLQPVQYLDGDDESCLQTEPSSTQLQQVCQVGAEQVHDETLDSPAVAQLQGGREAPGTTQL